MGKEIIADSNSLQNLILQGMGERIVLHDKNMRIRWANRAAADFYGMPLEEMYGNFCQELLGRTREECQDCPVKKVLQNGNQCQAMMSFPEGKTLLINAYPILDHGSLVGAIEVSVDITERADKEKELIRAKKESARANEAKSRFLAHVSHEIRTVMNVIMGMTDLVYEKTVDEEHKEYLEMIRDSSTFLLSLVNDLLDLSKIEAGKMELSHKYFYLHRKVEQIVSSFGLQAKKKDINLNLSIDSDVPRIVIGDYERLQQALINLVSNAVKFTHRGEVNVRVQLSQKEKRRPAGDQNGEQKKSILFTVSDTGVGIPGDQLDHIFKDFSQADTSHEGIGQEGTGLGLPITKKLVELMEGEIGVNSEPGKGSTFYFTIPLSIPLKPEININSLKGLETETETTEHPSPPEKPQLNILLAEDRAMNQKLTKIMLENIGHRVDVAGNGREAVEMHTKRQYDLILMDIHMPMMDGLEATGHIRAAEEVTERTPIIAMTASAMPEDRKECLEAGMDNYISKPISASELDEVLDETWQNRNRSRHIK